MRKIQTEHDDAKKSDDPEADGLKAEDSACLDEFDGRCLLREALEQD